jgi:hypothetical protein
MTRERRPSLQIQLLLTVGVLALAAVAAVAVASRYGTRLEFHRFQDTERRATADRVNALTAEMARRLDGRCCTGDQLDAVGAALGPDLALLVIDDADGSLAGSMGSPLDSLRGLSVRRTGRELAIEASRVHGDGSQEQFALTFRRDGTPLRLNGGQRAQLYLLPFGSQLVVILSVEFLC